MTRLETLTNFYNSLRSKGLIHTQRDLANLLGFNEGSISKALKGDERYLTSSLMFKIQAYLQENESAVPIESVTMFTALDNESKEQPKEERLATLPIIPIDAMGGTLEEFYGSIAMYDCERMVSPVKGAEYAMRVSGESMSPEYPNGCQILIKKINEKAFIEWGKVYVLDTENGAVIKKIKKTSKDNVIECVSINEDFQPFTIDTSFIRGWYRVLMVMSFK